MRRKRALRPGGGSGASLGHEPRCEVLLAVDVAVEQRTEDLHRGGGCDRCQHTNPSPSGGRGFSG